jgi:hypothetical protein
MQPREYIRQAFVAAVQQAAGSWGQSTDSDLGDVIYVFKSGDLMINVCELGMSHSERNITTRITYNDIIRFLPLDLRELSAVTRLGVDALDMMVPLRFETKHGSVSLTTPMHLYSSFYNAIMEVLRHRC